MKAFFKKTIRSRKWWGFIACIIFESLGMLSMNFTIAYSTFCMATSYQKRFEQKPEGE